MDELSCSALTLQQRQAVVLIALARFTGQTPHEWALLIRKLVLVIDPHDGQGNRVPSEAGSP